MKKTRSILSLLLALTLVLALCACGGETAPTAQTETSESVKADESKAEAAEPAASDESAKDAAMEESVTEEPPAEVTVPPLPVEGEYTAYAVYYDGCYIYADDIMSGPSTLSLKDGGTGTMTLGEEAMDITSWTVQDNAGTVVMADESSANMTTPYSGVVELDIYGDGSMIMVYVQEGADLSAYSPMTAEEYQAPPDSKLYAFWSAIDLTAGVHMNYDELIEGTGIHSVYEVHAKDGQFYKMRAMDYADRTVSSYTLFKDGTYYTLKPEDKTATVATTTDSSYVKDNILGLDSLGLDILNYARKKNFTVETRELDGTSYTCEVYPKTEYTPEIAFYYDESDKLVCCIEEAPVSENYAYLGRTIYTINAFDTAVDESLFDISEYTVTE